MKTIKITSLVLSLCLLLTACTTPHAIPPEAVEYEIDKAYIGLGYSSAMREDLERRPTASNDYEDIKTCITIETFFGTYTLKLWSNSGGLLRYKYSDDKCSIHYDVYKSSGDIANFRFYSNNINMYELFETTVGEEEYLQLAKTVLPSYRTLNFEEYSYNYEKNSSNNGARVTFAKYIDDIKTDDYATFYLKEHVFNISFGNCYLDDENIILPDKLYLRAVSDSCLLDSLNSAWKFTGYDVYDCVLKYDKGTFYVNFLYNVTVKEIATDKSIETFFEVDVYLK